METVSALLAICAGNSPVPGEFPAQRPVTQSYDVFFDLHPNKRLSKQWRGWWFETLSCPLWRHRNDGDAYRRKLTHWGRDKIQIGRRFPADTLKCIFLIENVRISVKNSLKFVPKGQINNTPALVQMMAWRRPGDMSHYLNQCWSVYWRIYASLSLSEVTGPTLVETMACHERY